MSVRSYMKNMRKYEKIKFILCAYFSLTSAVCHVIKNIVRNIDKELD